jgi:hypothetical protein
VLGATGECLLLAQSGHGEMSELSPLSGVKRTLVTVLLPARLQIE